MRQEDLQLDDVLAEIARLEQAQVCAVCARQRRRWTYGPVIGLVVGLVIVGAWLAKGFASFPPVGQN